MRATPTMSVSGKPGDVDGLIDELTGSLRETANDVVPWFLQRMPLVYFQDTDHATQLSHLRAIIAAKASGKPLELSLRSEDGSQWTLMRPLDYPGVLSELAKELPHDRPLRAAKIHSTTDGRLVLVTFEFGQGERFQPDDPKQARKLKDTIAYAAEHAPDWPAAEISAYFRRCTAEYVMTLTPLRICKQRELFQQVSGTDGTFVVLEDEADPRQSRIVVAAGNISTRIMLERVSARLSRSGISIRRAYVDMIDDGANGSVCMLGFVVTGPDGGRIDPASELWRITRRDLLRLKWLDLETLQLAYRHDELSLMRAEVIKSLGHLVQQVLSKVNAYAFSGDRIASMAERNLTQAVMIADLFMARFDPRNPVSDEAFKSRSAEIRSAINASVDLEDARTMLHKMLDAVHAVHRTNFYLDTRYALAMRIDPAFMTTPERPEVPFGVFYVHGRSFDGFHVRFRDIARGGLRVVRPVSFEHHTREMERLYDEVYGLAFAQQLKNKDIPEGGAKAIILIQPDSQLPRSVKAFVDSILDLITSDPETRKLIVDRHNSSELLYLGPDENITPEHIEWIVDRAKRRGYRTPNAFMSSKPGAGINHKTYGVTSEGVTVFLDVALRYVGIDPKKRPFTIKLTGGPDGDVAGNEIKILHRDYGDNARIVGIADGSGSAEDPDGLNHRELLRLVEASRPIAEFSRDKLGPRGRVVALNEPDGVHLRNTLHNRIVADAFIPAGGRPNAIHGGNWKDFLTHDGKPSSPVIVEGANLFLNPEARIRLSEAGTLIVKDSSANKCGVICSSFEISACMILSEQEFLAIKEQFVAEVIQRLRALARAEAELLLRLHKHHPDVPLPVMSISLSRVMIRTADAIEAAIDTLGEEDSKLMRQLVIDHLPPVLVKTAGQRLWNQTPKPYLKWIMAKSLAARVVYREGFDYLESMPSEAIADLAIRYLRAERELSRLAQQVSQSTLPDRQQIAETLTEAGILPRIHEW